MAADAVKPPCTVRHRALIQIDPLKPLAENILTGHSAAAPQKIHLPPPGTATPPRTGLGYQCRRLPAMRLQTSNACGDEITRL